MIRSLVIGSTRMCMMTNNVTIAATATPPPPPSRYCNHRYITVNAAGSPSWMESYEQLHSLVSNGSTFGFPSTLPLPSPPPIVSNQAPITDRYNSSVNLLFFGRTLPGSSSLVPHILLLKKQMRGRHGGQIALPGGLKDNNEWPLATAARELTEETGLAIDLTYHNNKNNTNSTSGNKMLPLQSHELISLGSLTRTFSVPSYMSCVRYVGQLPKFNTMSTKLNVDPFIGTFDWPSLVQSTNTMNGSATATTNNTSSSSSRTIDEPLWHVDRDEVEALIAVPLPLLRHGIHHTPPYNWRHLRDISRIPYADLGLSPYYIVPHSFESSNNDGLYASILTRSAAGNGAGQLTSYPHDQPLVVWGLTARVIHAAITRLHHATRAH
jgi:8-oxo-dGTP pyrophosphatase MutT (NUDIX family)